MTQYDHPTYLEQPALQACCMHGTRQGTSSLGRRLDTVAIKIDSLVNTNTEEFSFRQRSLFQTLAPSLLIPASNVGLVRFTMSPEWRSMRNN
jgi:hypothetical protein